MVASVARAPARQKPAARIRDARGARRVDDPPYAVRSRTVSHHAAALAERAEGALANLTAHSSAEWLARGRNHQWQHRPVDAMLCFRRAVREDPRAGNPRFHLGEVLWRLGRQAEAIDVWRDATQIAPSFPAARQALAEALITTGDAAGARVAAEVLLASNPADSRARAITVVA